jgi:zinc/manganese transport system permease protein
MIDHFPWWVLPSMAALILVATHTYLGLHVISRNVFFVDLALAQVAALGSTVAYLYGFEMNDPVTYYVSLLFAVVGAWFFSVARTRDNRVPQEAIIGLAFAVASAGAILLSAENPHGAEHLRDIMAGSILVVSAGEVIHAALFYGVIGIFHWFFRKQFLLVSMDREGAIKQGLRVQFWDFLFYLSFAIVITSSVRIAGVLLVFILLIAPAICGAMLAIGIRRRLLIGWGCGILATIGGLMMSSKMDWPPAPAISCVFAVILLGSGLLGSIAHAPKRGLAAAKFAGLGLAFVVGGFCLSMFLKSNLAWSWKAKDHEPTGSGGTHDKNHSEEAVHSHGKPEHGVGGSHSDLVAALWDEHDNVRAKAAEELGKLKDPSAVPDLVKALKDPSMAVKEKAAEALGVIGRPEAAEGLAAALSVKDEDEWVNLREAEALVRCGGMKGMSALIKMSSDADAKLVRTEALKKALLYAGRPALKSPEGAEGKAALGELAGWWKDVQNKARWDPAAGRFVIAP